MTRTVLQLMWFSLHLILLTSPTASIKVSFCTHLLSLVLSAEEQDIARQAGFNKWAFVLL